MFQETCYWSYCLYNGTLNSGHRGPSSSLVESLVYSMLRSPCPQVIWVILTLAHMLIIGLLTLWEVMAGPGHDVFLASSGLPLRNLS